MLIGTSGPNQFPLASYPMTYRIVRNYFCGKPRTIKRGLTLNEAKLHCSDPETSSSTATSSAARARTKRMGKWFDGFEKES